MYDSVYSDWFYMMPEELMIAKNLSEVMNLFAPNEPLQGRALTEFYVARPKGQIEPMRIFLEDHAEPVKILFTGHRGSGKSTELNKLASLMGSKFLAVQFSVRRVLDPLNVTYTDLLLSMAVRLFREVTDQRILNRRRRALVGDGLLDDVYRWFTQEIILEKIVEPKADAGLSANVNLLFVKLEGKVSTEAVTRRTIRERIEHRVSELVAKMDRVVAEVQRNSGRRVLIIVEDIDKLDLEAAKTLFLRHAVSLNAPQAHIIYTFPVALRNDNDWTHIKNSFSNRFVLPNIRLRNFEGAPNAGGIAVMRDMVLNRMDASLILSDALDLAVAMSGGLPFTLMELIQNAALSARIQKKSVIDLESVEEAVTEIRSDFQGMLEPAHYLTLRQYRQTRWLENEEAVREVLHNLSLLEYANDRRWCDVHPIVVPLLDQEEASRQELKRLATP